MYPITLELQGKSVVIAGGGTVAYRKIQSLMKAGANVTVVSPEAVDPIKDLDEEGSLLWIQKPVEDKDYEDAFIIIAATNKPEVNQQIAEIAKSRQLVNVVDEPSLGNFSVPAIVRRGRLLIAVSTGGASPVLAKRIKKELQDIYTSDYEGFTAFLYECRQLIKKWDGPIDKKHQMLNEILEERFLVSEEERDRFKRDLNREIDK